MWPLVFCMLTVGGVPISLTPEATSHTPDHVSVTSMLNVSQPATTEALKVSVKATQNVVSPAPGRVTLILDLPQQANAETLQELQDDTNVQEGDILIPFQENRNAVENLWADAIVPYTISYELAYREANIYTAFQMISNFTCIRFQQRTTEYNYLTFVSGNGCSSFVGCQGGPQPVYLSRACSVGNLCHEIIHALGLHHEHTRNDRDEYISVQWQSIIPGRQNNFMVKPGNTLNLPYDINSIMHYGKYFFSLDGSPTMLPKQSGGQMGQRLRLSQLDIHKLNRLYCD